MKRALTEEEYWVKAMLLGRLYARKSHCFIKYGGDEWLDADTLEPVSERERTKRREEYRNETQMPIHRQDD